ncbi:MAG TPA: M1 family aminopeptidase, partial [Bacteroidota bacterium]|nr:M1 family aminopeptidase [Bacteroidota bacterium]
YFDDLPEYWGEVAHMGRHALSFFSTHYGQYAYPSMFVVEGVVGGGMEYPGIVFLGHIGDKNNTDLYAVTAHEIGHNWFPMMIESNETYFAFMDEGFNTFITTTAIEDYYGRYNNSYNWTEWYQKLLHYPNDDDRAGNQRSSLFLAKTGYEEPIATHTNRFREQNLSGISIYSKTGSVMFMLQYVLGDSVFEHCMKEYYHRYKFKHVYPEDFYSTMQEASGNRDLRWFFDEWFNRTSTCDYGVSGLQSEQSKSDPSLYRTKISLRKYGDAIMPVDVQFTMENGTKQTVWFPVDQWLNSEVRRDTVIDLPSRAVKAELNPDGRILDINRLNNTTGMLPKIDFELNNTFFSIAPLDAYRIQWRPSLWYTDEGGVKPGIRFSGDYLSDMFRRNLYLGYNIREKTLDYEASVGENLFAISPLSTLDARLFHLEGREGGDITLQKSYGEHYSYQPYHTLTLQYSYIRAVDTDYLLHPETWQGGAQQRMIGTYQYQNRGERWTLSGTLILEASLGLLGTNDFQYSKRTIELKGTYNLPDGILGLIRGYNGMGFGNVPVQSQYYLSGGSPIEQFSAPLFRSKGIFPTTVRDHAFFPGGGDMRGYFNLPASGTKIEAVNAEARFSSFLPVVKVPSIPLISYITRQFNSAVFFDAGRLASDPANLWDQKFEVDWGFGFRMVSFPRILGEAGRSNLLPLIGLRTLRVDFPVYLSAPLPGEKKLSFRWTV